MLQLSTQFPLKRAFITGAGSGIGRELALLLAADGWALGITDIAAAPLADTKAAIIARGGSATNYTFDIADRNQYASVFQDFVTQYKGLDLLINNAGVGDGGLFEEYHLDHWEWIIGINQMAVIYGCHFAIPITKRQGAGHIINIASAAGFATMPNMAMYNVPKAAVIAASESLYAELKPHGVSVSVVMPTFVKTNIMQHHRGPAEANKIGEAMVNRAKHTPQQLAHYILTQAGKGRFHIFFPFQSRLVWVLKRLFPSLFLKVKVWVHRRRDTLGRRILE